MTNTPGNFIAAGTLEERFNAGAPTNGVDEVWSIASTATGGTIGLKVTWAGQTLEATVPFNATAAAVVAALVGLNNVGAGGVIGTGGPLGTNPVVITGAAQLSGVPFTIAVDNTSATGGVATATETTAGVKGTQKGAATGACLSDITNGNRYVNSGTAVKPTWTQI